MYLARSSMSQCPGSENTASGVQSQQICLVLCEFLCAILSFSVFSPPLKVVTEVLLITLYNDFKWTINGPLHPQALNAIR